MQVLVKLYNLPYSLTIFDENQMENKKVIDNLYSNLLKDTGAAILAV